MSEKWRETTPSAAANAPFDATFPPAGPELGNAPRVAAADYTFQHAS